MLFTITMRSNVEDVSSLTTTTSAIDRPNRRVASTTIMDDEGPDNFDSEFYFIYDNGDFKSAATFEGELEKIPFDEATETLLKDQLEGMFEMLDTPVVPEYTSASYAGRRAYADVLEGIQINVDASEAMPTMPGMESMAVSDMAMVLNGELELTGMVMTLAGEKLVIVFAEPSPFTNLNMVPEMSYYLYDEAQDSATLQSVMSMSYDAFNEPLDPALFELPEASSVE